MLNKYFKNGRHLYDLTISVENLKKSLKHKDAE